MSSETELNIKTTTKLLFKNHDFAVRRDTVLMSKTEDDLQYQVHCFLMYCEKGKCHVNVEKNKIMIFGKGRQTSTVSFLYNNN